MLRNSYLSELANTLPKVACNLCSDNFNPYYIAIVSSVLTSILTGIFQCYASTKLNKDSRKERIKDLINTIDDSLDIDCKNYSRLYEDYMSSLYSGGDMKTTYVTELSKNGDSLSYLKCEMYLIKDKQLKHLIDDYICKKNEHLTQIKFYMNYRANESMNFLVKTDQNELNEDYTNRMNLRDLYLKQELCKMILELCKDCHPQVKNIKKLLYLKYKTL